MLWLIKYLLIWKILTLTIPWVVDMSLSIFTIKKIYFDSNASYFNMLAQNVTDQC